MLKIAKVTAVLKIGLSKVRLFSRIRRLDRRFDEEPAKVEDRRSMGEKYRLMKKDRAYVRGLWKG